MRCLRTWLVLAIAVLAGAAATVRAESVSALVAEGNRLYREGRLAEALEKYAQAEKASPGSAAIQYNIGNVLYRQGEYEKAHERYRQAFSARERDLAEGARFNAGNSYFARKNWPEAIRNYKEALRLDPTDGDAKRNLELALLNMQEEQKKQQQQQQQQPQDQEQNQDQDQKNQDNDPSRQDQQQQQPAPQPRDQKAPQEDARRLSREEAMRILDAMREQDRPPSDQLKVPPPDRRPEKDW